VSDIGDLFGDLGFTSKDVALDALKGILETSRGRLTAQRARAIAAHAGVAERTVYRWAETVRAAAKFDQSESDERTIWERLEEDGPDAFEFTDELISLVYGLDGNLTAFYAQMTDAGFELPSYITVTRRWGKLDPLVRDGARNGQRNANKLSLKIRHEAAYVNQVWELDDVWLDIEVLRKRKGKAVTRPHLLLMIDDFSRFIVAWALLPSDPRSADTLALLADAFEIRPADDGSGVMLGGVCETLSCDNAGYFRSMLVEESLALVPTMVRPNPAHCPTSKAKVERVNATIQTAIVQGLAGSLTNSASRSNKALMAAKPGSLLTFDELLAHVGDVIHHYNYDRVHSSIGMTPFERYSSRTAAPEVVDDAILASMWLPGPRAGGERKVHGDGVKVFRGYWMAPELKRLIGKDVEVRTLHHRRDRLAVFYNDTFVAFAARPSELTEAERRAVTQVNIDAQKAVNHHAKAARGMQAATTRAMSTGGERNPAARAAAPEPDDVDEAPPAEDTPPDRSSKIRKIRPANKGRTGDFPAKKAKRKPGLDLAAKALDHQPDPTDDEEPEEAP
jgi:transposase InsO family protein